MSSPEPNPQSPPVKPQESAQIAPEEAAPAKSLTPEEQMARFEEDLKFNDWGHQPC